MAAIYIKATEPQAAVDLDAARRPAASASAGAVAGSGRLQVAATAIDSLSAISGRMVARAT